MKQNQHMTFRETFIQLELLAAEHDDSVCLTVAAWSYGGKDRPRHNTIQWRIWSSALGQGFEGTPGESLAAYAAKWIPPESQAPRPFAAPSDLDAVDAGSEVTQ